MKTIACFLPVLIWIAANIWWIESYGYDEIKNDYLFKNSWQEGIYVYGYIIVIIFLTIVNIKS